MTKRNVISSSAAPKAIGPYSQAIRIDELVFTSGMLGLDPMSGNLVEGGLDAQVRQALDNLQAVLNQAGANLETVVKTTVFLKHMTDFAAMNAIYAEYFKDSPPARSTVEVAALPKGALFEIEAVAILTK
jgi:2-iminobutanoate/2-iminopropanoate deaminase